MSERARLLQIKREFLLEKHKEAECIIMQDKFNYADIEKLQGYYNMCEEYAGFFNEFVTRDVNDLKANIKKIMNDQSASFNMGKFAGRVVRKLKNDD